MESETLQPGKTYKVDEFGKFHEVTEVPVTAVPISDEDLPPDMRNKVSAEASQKVQEIHEQVQKISESLGTSNVETADSTLSVPVEEKMSFLKSVISNKPYKRQYKIFNESVILSFKTLSTEELDAISEAIVIQSARVPYSSMMAMAGAHMRFAMASALCDITYNGDDGITGAQYSSVLSSYPDTSKLDTYYKRDEKGVMVKQEHTIQPTPGHKVLWAAIDRFKGMGVPVYNALFSIFQQFDRDVVTMTNEASNHDFFQNGVDGL